MDDTLKGIWEIADEMRAQGVKPDLLSVLTETQKRGLALSSDNIRSVSERFPRSTTPVCPSYIPEFITAYLDGCSAKTILDPWAGVGTLLIALTSNFTPEQAIGIVTNPAEHKIARFLSGDADVEWKLADPYANLDTFQDGFDIVASAPPWTTQTRAEGMIAADGDRIEISDHVGNLVILKSSQMLKPNGSAFFVVPPGFFYKSARNDVYANLERFNLFLHAALKLPKDALAPYSMTGGYLIVLKKHKLPSLFVAELTSDRRNNSIVLGNLIAREEGQALQLGALVDGTDFISFDELVRQRELENIVAENDLHAFKLSVITQSINFVKSPESFSDSENSVYLPLIGNRPAVTSIERLDETKLHHHNCAQLIVDPELANAQYLASFFSGPIGRRVRDSLLSPSMIPKINRPSLRSATVYLPKKEIQAEISLIDSSIEELSTKLGVLQQQLWNNPKNRKKIQEELKTFTRRAGDDFKMWIDTLPTPIATILWAYLVADRPDDKVGYLVNFFEALIVFNATVLLSAYEKDAFYAEQLKVWLKRFKAEKLCKREFGSWMLLLEILSGKTRKLLNDASRDARLELFGNFGGDDLFRLLVDERLGPVLKEAKKIRDKYAHDPHAGDAESEKRLKVLRSCLSEFRGIVADQYESVLLFNPLENRHASGIFHYKVQQLKGTRPLPNADIDTLTELEDKKLHLAYKSESRTAKRPVELLPFIEFTATPETHKNACYFYDCVDRETVRYVPYAVDLAAKIKKPENTKAMIDAILKLKMSAEKPSLSSSSIP